MEELEIHLKQRIYRLGPNLCIYIWYHYVFLLFYFVYWRSIDNSLLRALSAIDEAATDVNILIKM
jgi:hypothetical protein